MLEKDFRFSVDKLCILGKFMNIGYYDLLLNYCNNNLRFNRKYIDTQFYSSSFLITDLGFLQFDRPTLNFRLEFNPNNINNPLDRAIIDYILNFMTDFHFSRLDIALDLYNYNLKSYNIIDINRRKTAYYYSDNKEIETIYLGSMGSNKFIRIYDKAKEQKIKDKDWFRVELQLRDEYIDLYLLGIKDFLEGVYFFKYTTLDNYSFIERATLEYLLNDTSRFKELTKNQKTKYKNMIKTLELESLDFINDIIKHSFSSVVDYLQELCPILYTNERYSLIY